MNEDTVNLILKDEEEILAQKSLLLKIPYFNSLLKENFKIEKVDSKIIVNIPKIYLLVILKFLEKQDFFYLYSNLSLKEDILNLLETFDFLGLELPEINMNITEISELIKVKSYDIDELEEYKQRKVGRSMAALLGIGLFKQMYDMNDLKERNKFYECTLFIVSHPRTYKKRFKFHFHKIAKNCGVLSKKQWDSIDKWIFDEYSDGSESLSDHEYHYSRYCDYGSDYDGYASYGSD
eukprot:gene2920-4759_t